MPMEKFITSFPTDRKGLVLTELNSFPGSNGTQARASATAQDLVFAICRNGYKVGGIRLLPDNYGAAEIGFWLEEGQTGKGYATLAVRAMVKYGDYDALYATVPEENEKAAAVLTRSNFVEFSNKAGQILFCEGRFLERTGH